MQAQATRQTNEQHQITLHQSQVAIRTLLSASFGCILFLRSLLPEDNFGQTYLVVGDNKGSNDSSTVPSSQSSNRDGGNNRSRYKIMTVKRGFSQEGDGILDYLEKGAFDALEKQYLRRMVFALYIEEEDRQNIVEAWNFDFTYQQIPDSELKLPMLSMSNSLSQDSQSSQMTTNAEIRSPTLGEVKASIRNMVHKLIAITQTLEELPKKRYATFKLEYYPHTPDDYEPPLFVAGGDDRRKMVFSTHDINEPPFRVNIGKVETGFNNITLEVHSIAGSLPSASTAHDKMHLVGVASEVANKRDGDHDVAEADVLAQDAQRRNIVWDADVKADNPVSTQDGLLGQRMPDGSIAPMGKCITGRAEKQAAHVDQLDFSRSSDMEETQPNDSDSVAPTGIIARSSSIMRDTPMESPTRPSPHLEQDVADTMGKLTIAQDTQAEDELMDLETQQVQASWLSQQSEPAKDSNRQRRLAPQSQIDESDESIEVEVHCDCAIQREAEDYDVCQCEGPCGRWIHLWCHGYHGCKDPRLPENFKCFECRLRATQASVILAESSIKQYLVKYADLALFRRALKIIEVEDPPSTSEFRKFVGCSAQVATQLWKRLEREDFIGLETIEQDGLGLFETRSLAPGKKIANKPRVRKTAKTRYTKNPLIANMYTEYFDPSEEVERKHVGLGRKERTERKLGSQEPRVQSTSRNSLSFNSAQPQTSQGGKADSSHQDNPGVRSNDSRAQQVDRAQPPSRRGKRKADDADDDLLVPTPLRRSKRIKISVPRKDIDLEW